MSASSRPFTFDRVVRIVAGLLLLLLAVWLVNQLRNVLLPFALACLIAYLLEPIVEFNKRLYKLKGRGLASMLTLLEVTIVIAVLAYFFVPSVIKEINQLDEIMRRTTEGSSIPFVPADIAATIHKWVDDFNVASFVKSSHFMNLINSGTSFLAATVDFLLHTLEWLLTFIYVIFIMIDYPTLMRGFRMLVPKKYRHTIYKVEDDIKDNMNRYFRSQALIALCAAVFYCIGFSIVGIPMAIVLGITVGVLYMIPYFQYVTLIPVAIVCLVNSSTGAAQFWPQLGECIIVYIVSQCICDYVLTPKIMGKTMGLNPAVILLSLSIWGTLLGLLGMIIALPATALLLSYYQKYVVNAGLPDNEDEADSEPADQ